VAKERTRRKRSEHDVSERNTHLNSAASSVSLAESLLSLRPSALVSEQVSMHYERSDQVERTNRAAAAGSEGMLQWWRWRRKKVGGRGGRPCSRGAIKKQHTLMEGLKGERQSESESEVVSMLAVVVVSSSSGSSTAAAGPEVRRAPPTIQLARVKQPNFMRRRFLFTDHSVDSPKILTSYYYYGCCVSPDNHLLDIDPSPVRPTTYPACSLPL